jgi:hypothetical protein
MVRQRYPFNSADYHLFDDYDGSSEKITVLVDSFTQKWGRPEKIPRYAVIQMAKRLKKTTVKEPYWTWGQMEYLNDNYGVIPDSKICKHLHRTRVSITLKAKRMHINRKINIMTSRSVAEICGIPDSHTVIMWIRKGLLKGKKSPTHCGRTTMWNIDDSSLAKMLKNHPWLAYLQGMPDSYYRRLVEREWARDPWFYRSTTAEMLGVKNPHFSLKYIKRGWLKGEKMPGGRHSNTRWVFRASSIMEFLDKDPRKAYHKKLLSITKKAKSLLVEEKAVQLYGVWILICPRCKKAVGVKAPPTRECKYSPGVMNAFLASLDGNAECIHGKFVDLNDCCTSYYLVLVNSPSSSFFILKVSGGRPHASIFLVPKIAVRYGFIPILSGVPSYIIRVWPGGRGRHDVHTGFPEHGIPKQATASPHPP